MHSELNEPSPTHVADKMIIRKFRVYCVAGLAIAAMIALFNNQFLQTENHLIALEESKSPANKKIVTASATPNHKNMRASWGPVTQLSKQINPEALPLQRFEELRVDLEKSMQNTTHSLDGYPVVHRGNEPKGPVTRIALLGERNTGTQWMYSELNKCFNHTLRVTRDLSRYKHWFQHEDPRDHSNVLVVAQFRDPYYWTAAMIEKPHHSPLHVKLDWKGFVTKPWTMPRPERDLPLANATGPVCQQKFHYHEIVSCVPGTRPEGEEKPFHTFFSGYFPQYELMLDGNGEAYKSILQLRADKIVNFLNTSSYEYVSNTMVVQYEQLVSRGTKSFIRQIEELTGVKAECPAIPPQDRPKRELDKEFVQWIDLHSDWALERLVGYEKM